ncbi:MAG: dihydroneopterin aldolase [Selenomonadaceae bacterium]|nr:dihydroneopterin aldolase [Selenomonadaceae bacterium]
MDEIKLNGLEFFGYHGCLPHEHEIGQLFLVDVSLDIDLKPAGQHDELADTVNYSEIYDLIREIMTGETRKLIEALAEDIAASILQAHPAVCAAHVSVHKPYAPLPGKFRDVSVSITRDRQDLADD